MASQGRREEREDRTQRLRGAAAVGLKLGLLGFGGPAAHVALLQDEVCERRRWLSREGFLDLVGATHLIPGPNSSELILAIGRMRAGLPGLLLAGLGFIVPAMLITGVLAWAYVRFGDLPQAPAILAGVKPAVLALILAAICRLARTAIKDWRLGLIAVAVMVTSYARGHEILLLLLGSIAGALWREGKRISRGPAAAAGLLLGLLPVRSAWGAGLALGTAGISGVGLLLKLFLFFLLVGSILYGSGYVLIAFIEGSLVEQHGWLTHQELLDAVAVGQLTPGPLLSTATFVGYVVCAKLAPGLSVVAALACTAAVFLPSFVLIILLGGFLLRLRQVRWLGGFLDAVNASALGLMASVLLKLGESTLFPGAGLPGMDWRAAAVIAGAAVGLLVLRLNAAWIVLGGALLGYGLGRIW